MLEELIALQECTLGLIRQMEELLGEPVPERSKLANLRWRLTQASFKRLKLLENRIFPALLDGASERERAVLSQLAEDSRMRRGVSAGHVARWSLDAALGDWNGYRQASDAVRAGMLARIDLEREQLVPLVARLEAQRSGTSWVVKAARAPAYS